MKSFWRIIYTNQVQVTQIISASDTSILNITSTSGKGQLEILQKMIGYKIILQSHFRNQIFLPFGITPWISMKWYLVQNYRHKQPRKKLGSGIFVLSVLIKTTFISTRIRTAGVLWSYQNQYEALLHR